MYLFFSKNCSFACCLLMYPNESVEWFLFHCYQHHHICCRQIITACCLDKFETKREKKMKWLLWLWWWQWWLSMVIQFFLFLFLLLYSLLFCFRSFQNQHLHWIHHSNRQWYNSYTLCVFVSIPSKLISWHIQCTHTHTKKHCKQNVENACIIIGEKKYSYQNKWWIKL